MPDPKFRRKIPHDRYFFVLAAWLAAIFLLGGGSRGDILSLVLLRPLAAVMLVVGAWGFTRDRIVGHRFLAAMALAIVVLGLAHLVPLPAFAWQALPGRAIVAQIDAAAGLGVVWRPLALSSFGAWNSAFSLFVPVSVLVLGLRQSPAGREGLVAVFLVLCGLSALLGLVQVLGPANGPLYLYKITNSGAPVGFFSNRNHHSALLACSLPLAAVFAAGGERGGPGGGQSRLIGALAIVLLVLPVLLATGSRAGLLLAAVGLVSIPFVYGIGNNQAGAGPSHARLAPKRWMVWVGFGLVTLGLVALFADNHSLARFGNTGSTDEERLRAWPVVLTMIGKYFPFGSGFGSFDQVFRIDEPIAMVRRTYFYHAHNDWLEVALTGGLSAMALVVAAIVAWGLAMVHLIRFGDRRTSGYRLGLAGGVIILILAAASAVDYPLRTPSLAALFTIAALWLSAAAASAREPLHQNL